MVRHAFIVVTLLALGAAQTASQSEPRPAPEAVARDLQKKYDTIRDFSADFVHTYQGGVLRKQAIERGALLIKKPGKMRWTYMTPEKKLFVSDGTKMYSYVPLDNQVIVSNVPDDKTASAPVLFLAGKGDLTRDFTASYGTASEAPAGSRILTLVPRQSEADYESITLVLDRELRITVLITIDGQGGRSAFAFSNFKENLGLSDKEFTFKVPRGADVITDDRPSL